MNIDVFKSKVNEIMEQIFGDGQYEEDSYRIVVDDLGLFEGCAIVEALFENGLYAEAPYPVMHFHVTITDNVPEENFDKLKRGISELNNAIAMGEFKALGMFGLYEPFGQVYLTYRLPCNIDMLEEELFNVKYFLGSLYEELDLFVDYFFFLINAQEEISLDDYMGFLEKTINGAEEENEDERFRLTEEQRESIRQASAELHMYLDS